MLSFLALSQSGHIYWKHVLCVTCSVLPMATVTRVQQQRQPRRSEFDQQQLEQKICLSNLKNKYSSCVCVRFMQTCHSVMSHSCHLIVMAIWWSARAGVHGRFRRFSVGVFSSAFQEKKGWVISVSSRVMKDLVYFCVKHYSVQFLTTNNAQWNFSNLQTRHLYIKYWFALKKKYKMMMIAQAKPMSFYTFSKNHKSMFYCKLKLTLKLLQLIVLINKHFTCSNCKIIKNVLIKMVN